MFHLSHVLGELASVLSHFPRQIFCDVDVGPFQESRLAQYLLTVFVGGKAHQDWSWAANLRSFPAQKLKGNDFEVSKQNERIGQIESLVHTG